MKAKYTIVSVMLIFARCLSTGQGIFTYDQQSSTDETVAGNTVIQQAQVVGQSFAPSLSSVDFIRLKLSDNNPASGVGVVMYVNLLSNSIAGTIFSQTQPVTLSNGFAGVVNFIFPNSVALTPGTTYFFQPIVQSGDLWNIDIEEYNYPNGTAFYQGQPMPSSDLWFREGVVVPEPSAALLLLLGSGALIRRRRRTQ